MTTSIALFDCPHCIDEFAFDYEKIKNLAYGWRVRVRCPGCGNIVEVVMLAYTVIHGWHTTQQKGQRGRALRTQHRPGVHTGTLPRQHVNFARTMTMELLAIYSRRQTLKMFAALVPLVGCTTGTGGASVNGERVAKFQSDLRVYDALGMLQIRAFRVAKANNQWTEQDGEPYITQDQLNDLVAEILKEQGIHVVNGKIHEP